MCIVSVLWLSPLDAFTQAVHFCCLPAASSTGAMTFSGKGLQVSKDHVVEEGLSGHIEVCTFRVNDELLLWLRLHWLETEA